MAGPVHVAKSAILTGMHSAYEAGSDAGIALGVVLGGVYNFFVGAKLCIVHLRLWSRSASLDGQEHQAGSQGDAVHDRGRGTHRDQSSWAPLIHTGAQVLEGQPRDVQQPGEWANGGDVPGTHAAAIPRRGAAEVALKWRRRQ